jgi:hypothetical protein
MFLVVYWDLFCVGIAWLLLAHGWWPVALPFVGASAFLTSALAVCGTYHLVEPWLPPDVPLTVGLYRPARRRLGPRRVIHRPDHRPRPHGRRGAS